MMIDVHLVLRIVLETSMWIVGVVGLTLSLLASILLMLSLITLPIDPLTKVGLLVIGMIPLSILSVVIGESVGKLWVLTWDQPIVEDLREWPMDLKVIKETA